MRNTSRANLHRLKRGIKKKIPFRRCEVQGSFWFNISVGGGFFFLSYSLGGAWNNLIVNTANILMILGGVMAAIGVILEVVRVSKG
jgi:hypothetical protein